jgi:hypothetical protein
MIDDLEQILESYRYEFPSPQTRFEVVSVLERYMSQRDDILNHLVIDETIPDNNCLDVKIHFKRVDDRFNIRTIHMSTANTTLNETIEPKYNIIKHKLI